MHHKGAWPTIATYFIIIETLDSEDHYNDKIGEAMFPLCGKQASLSSMRRKLGLMDITVLGWKNNIVYYI